MSSESADLFATFFGDDKKKPTPTIPSQTPKPSQAPVSDFPSFNDSPPAEKPADVVATVAPTAMAEVVTAKEVIQHAITSPPVKQEVDFGFPSFDATPPTTIKSAEELRTDFISLSEPSTITPTLIEAQTDVYDYSDAPKNKLMVITVYGLKGPGKTYSSFCLEGSILCISFDRKSETVHIEEFNSDPRITVKDALRYLDKTTETAFTASSDKTFKYLVSKEPPIGILEKYKQEGKKFDWVMLDCTEEMNRICEMVMRYRAGLMPSQGVANRNLWKNRRLYINAIHNASVDIANKGIIYTTYTDETKIIKDGEIVALETLPKWIDVQMLETDVVIHVTVDQSYKTNERKFIGVVDSSKYKLFPTGKRADITGKGLKALMKDA